MCDPMISVIVPVFNVAPFLREALDSVVHQTYRNLEIFIIDDGSTDGSGSICDEYKTDHRVTIIHQTHQNVSCARNVGLEHATGEYIAFLDPDDAYDLSFMQTMLESALRENSDIVVCKCYILHTDKEMKPVAKSDMINESYPSAIPGQYNRKDALRSLLNANINISIWNKLYKSELWKNIRFPIDYDVAEDVAVSINVFDLCNTVYVNDQRLYFHRKHNGSLVTVFTEKYNHDRIQAHNFMEEYIEAHIPDIFSDVHVMQYRLGQLKLWISRYPYVKDTKQAKEIRDQIIELVEQIGMANCDIRTRANYYMIRFCPLLFSMLYTMYLPIRLWIKKVTGH